MNTPFGNCKYRICDLPGQCRDEGHCHHPASGERGQGTDTARLDYLDKRNALKNESHGTVYRWQLNENHNRIALETTDFRL